MMRNQRLLNIGNHLFLGLFSLSKSLSAIVIIGTDLFLVRNVKHVYFGLVQRYQFSHY